MFTKTKKAARGFTLIEILVVIGLIAILAAIVLIAINPARQFAQARNSQRESNVSTILNAVGQSLADNKGLPLSSATCASIGTAPGASPTNIGTGSGLVNLTCLVGIYIPSVLPADPTDGTAADTKYTIEYNGSRYKVCAPGHAETAIVPTPASYCLER